jgi:hypothetical protein
MMTIFFRRVLIDLYVNEAENAADSRWYYNKKAVEDKTFCSIKE